MMKAFAGLIIFAIAAASACAQSQGYFKGSVEGERFILPRDTFYGWAQLDVAPPHNEIDPNLCAGNAKDYGGAQAQCDKFGRYALSGLVEARPFGKGELRRIMFWVQPSFLFGKNVPQSLYTWSANPIGVAYSWGAAVYLGAGFEARFTQHPLMSIAGAHTAADLGPAFLGGNGPWGRYTSFAIRKYFGVRRW
jgi:hypothetical protein